MSGKDFEKKDILKNTVAAAMNGLQNGYIHRCIWRLARLSSPPPLIGWKKDSKGGLEYIVVGT